MSAPPSGDIEFERTGEGLMVWFSVPEKIALGELMIASGLLSLAATEEVLSRLRAAERGHVDDVIDRMRRARGESHPMDATLGDDW